MIFDETNGFSENWQHDHVLVLYGATEMWECTVGGCTFAITSEEMPDMQPPPASQPRTEEFIGNWADGQRDESFWADWKSTYSPKMGGRQWEYEQAVQYGQATYGPGRPLLDRNGKERGWQW